MDVTSKIGSFFALAACQHAVCFTTKFNVGERERSMWAAVTLSNGSTTEVPDDNLKQKLKFLPHILYFLVKIICFYVCSESISSWF